MLHCRTIAIWLLPLFAGIVCATGCSVLSDPARAVVKTEDDSATKQSKTSTGSNARERNDTFKSDSTGHEVQPALAASQSELHTALASGDWVERIASPTSADAEDNMPRGHWRHAGLESLLSRADALAQLRAAARSKEKLIAANAAIGLAQFNETGVLPRLVKIVRDTSLKLPMRGAAIEAVGLINGAEADAALTELVDEFGQYRGQAKARYVPELHADLIRTIANRPSDRHEAALRAALDSPAMPVRLAATRSYRQHRCPCPKELVDRTADEAAAVRASAILALAQAQHEEAQACAERALTDYDLLVRLSAIEALGVLPAAENTARLSKLAENTSDVIRAAAVRALAFHGRTTAVVQAATDKSSRVRAAVAESLIRLPPVKRDPLAQALLNDSSLEVQRRMIQSLASWPDDRAIPLLFAAIEGRAAVTRREAVEQLQARWPAAADLSAQASPERLAEQLASLRQLWQQDHPGRGLEQPAAAIEDDAVTDEPLETIERLAAASVRDRRAAARELVLKHSLRPLTYGALSRIGQLIEREADSLVWIDVLSLVYRDERAPAAELAAVAASHPAGDVRRRACAYFGEHPSRQATDLLLNSLEDQDFNVVHEAVRSLAMQVAIPDLSRLEALLISSDGALRVDAAMTLARHGSETGIRALLRSTYHQDPVVRRQAADALGSVFSEPSGSVSDSQRREAIAELARLLDDKADVRRAAHASLERMGANVPRSATDPGGAIEGTPR